MPNEILNAAQNGELALFCGAGISTESKSVLPYSFYKEIQEELEIVDNSLSFSKLMQMYCDLPNGRRKLLKKIKARFEYIHSFPELERATTKFHHELAELYFIKTIITTNWDAYFEKCCAATPITTPEDYVFWDENERCVLKIHGSIDNLGSIIATEDDYIKCSDNLEKGIIGATLKTILAKKTVVFIGFSFGDEDFKQIIEYLQAEMKEIMPHIYIVTIDEQLSTKLNYKNATYILTDGTYFLHQLKLDMIERNLIENCDTLPIIKVVNNAINELHDKIAHISINTYPCVIYCLAYQDGIIHAFERFIQLYNTGNYNIPGIMSSTVRAYDGIKQKCTDSKNYWDEAYYEGYLNGLILIASCEENQDIIKEFPYTYLPNAKCVLNSYDTFFMELKRVTKKDDKYHMYAKAIIEKLKEPDMVVHHPPY
jgi:hypothetical protein